MIKRILVALVGAAISLSAFADHKGDYYRGATVDCMWNSFDSSGASVTRSTDGTITVYKDGNTSGTTTGVTDNEDFNSLTGVHHVSIATTDAFYATRTDYHVVLSGATIDSQTVNAVLCSFSIENNVSSRIQYNGTAQGGAATSITLAAAATSADDEVINHWVHIVGGTGADQTRLITASNTTTEVATVNRAWDTNPDATSIYEIEASELTYIQASGGIVVANMTQISGDSTAADNLEAALDGTGGVTIDADLAGTVDDIGASGLTNIGTAVEGVDVNVGFINDCEITGDGNATPFNSAC